jgi:TetR/AcrR family transcriptional repressor of nem operon
MNGRKQQILDVAAELLQSRSFTSFSYQDLSERLGISKPSIHHHFPTKEDLLLALTERYRARQARKLLEIEEANDTPRARLDAFLGMMSTVAASGQKICPVGALHAELNVIPERVRETVRQLYETPKQWLSGVLREGRAAGELTFDGPPEDRAALILAAVQGALQIARAEGAREFEAVVREIRTSTEILVGTNRG